MLLASGVYDLTPLVHTYVNQPLGLDDAGAPTLSVHAPRPPDVQVLVVHGDNETDACKAQSARLAAAWAAPLVEVVGRHHFDLVFDLAALDQRHDLWPVHVGGAAAARASGRRGGGAASRRSLRPIATTSGWGGRRPWCTALVPTRVHDARPGGDEGDGDEPHPAGRLQRRRDHSRRHPPHLEPGFELCECPAAVGVGWITLHDRVERLLADAAPKLSAPAASPPRPPMTAATTPTAR